MNSTAQVSLEWLLLAAAFLALFAVLLPAFQLVAEAGFWGLEVAKAKSFADSFQQKTVLLNALGNGSRMVMRVSTGMPWIIKTEENRLEVWVLENEREKRFERQLSFPAISTEFEVVGSVQLVLQKQNNVLIVNRQFD